MSNRIAVTPRDFSFVDELEGVELRRKAKTAAKAFIGQVSESAGKSADEISKGLFREVAERKFGEDRGTLMALFGPMI
jgi:hypothetical protein